MSTLQFPASPSPGQSFTAENGVTYTYDSAGGGGWTATNPIGIEDEYVNIDGDTMTGDLVLPNLEASGDIQSTSQNGGQLAGFRNQIINGDFRVAQRGSAFDESGKVRYTLDRWLATADDGAGNNVVTRSGQTPVGLPFSVALSAGSNALQQGVELDSTGVAGKFAVGSTWTLSVYSNRDITGQSSFMRFRDGVSVQANEVTAATVGNWVEVEAADANGFARYAITATITGSPAATNTNFSIYLPSGQMLSNSARYSGVQLEPGPVATPFEHRPIGTELALCQRYFWSGGTLIAMPIGSANPTDRVCVAGCFPTEMRTTPTQSYTLGNMSQINTSLLSNKYYYMAGVGLGGNGVGGVLSNYTADAEL